MTEMESKYQKVCPECGADMINDAFEKITILQNNDIEIKTFYPAWVCSKRCGFFVEIVE